MNKATVVMIALALLFTASLPALCATMCAIRVCPDMEKVATGEQSCCHPKSGPQPVSDCKVQMNKEAPPVAKAELPVLTFSTLILWIPFFISSFIEQMRLPVAHEVPAPRDHSPPLEALGTWAARAPPIVW